MSELVDTGHPKFLGKCAECGYDIYEFCSHSCPTAGPALNWLPRSFRYVPPVFNGERAERNSKDSQAKGGSRDTE